MITKTRAVQVHGRHMKCTWGELTQGVCTYCNGGRTGTLGLAGSCWSPGPTLGCDPESGAAAVSVPASASHPHIGVCFCLAHHLDRT